MMNQTQNKEAAYGCFLIVPLKYDPDSLDRIRLGQIGSCVPMTTMDLNENIKAMFAPSDEATVGRGYTIPSRALAAPLGSQAGKKAGQAFQVADESETFAF